MKKLKCPIFGQTPNDVLDPAIKQAETCGTGVYIEVVTAKSVASVLPQKMHESVERLYPTSLWR